MVLSILKYTFFILVALVLLIIGQAVFILQGGIGFQSNIFLFPIKLLPIFFYTFLICWLLLKMFDYKKKIVRRWSISFLCAIGMVFLSLFFQSVKIDKRAEPFILKNKEFSHLPPILINNNFMNRLILSATGYMTLLPWREVDKDAVDYLANLGAEFALISEIKKLIEKVNIANTCKKFIKKIEMESGCALSLQKEIYNRYQLSSPAKILFLVITTLTFFNEKELFHEKYGKDDSYVLAKLMNDFIEINLLQLYQGKFSILNENNNLKLSMGYQIIPDSYLANVEKSLCYKEIKERIKASNELVKTDIKFRKEKIKDSKILELMNREKKRLDKLKVDLFSLQDSSFNLDQVKRKQEETEEKLKIQIKTIKQKSLILKLPFLSSFL